MRTSIKTLQEVGGLSNLRTYTGVVRKSGKPDLPTTAILDLCMRRSERDRITKELERLKKKRVQMRERLKEVEKEMTTLLSKATKIAVEIRGPSSKARTVSSGQKVKMVLGY